MVIVRLDFKRLLTALFGMVATAVVFMLPQQLQPERIIETVEATLAPDAPAMTFIPPTAAPATEVVSNLAPYPNYGPAAEIHNEVWLNTATPLRLADLRGQVVLLEFWTFDCINCIHVLPHVREWHHAYGDAGLTVIGIHYPEFDHERDYDNLAAAIERLDVPFAVAQDNDGLSWRAYGQRYWPTIYLIDKRGSIRYQRIGEGGYEETEAAIQALLAESYSG